MENDLPSRSGLKGAISKRQAEHPYLRICGNNNNDNERRVKYCCSLCGGAGTRDSQDGCLLRCYERQGMPAPLPGN